MSYNREYIINLMKKRRSGLIIKLIKDNVYMWSLRNVIDLFKLSLERETLSYEIFYYIIEHRINLETLEKHIDKKIIKYEHCDIHESIFECHNMIHTRDYKFVKHMEKYKNIKLRLCCTELRDEYTYGTEYVVDEDNNQSVKFVYIDSDETLHYDLVKYLVLKHNYVDNLNERYLWGSIYYNAPKYITRDAVTFLNFDWVSASYSFMMYDPEMFGKLFIKHSKQQYVCGMPVDVYVKLNDNFNDIYEEEGIPKDKIDFIISDYMQIRYLTR